ILPTACRKALTAISAKISFECTGVDSSFSVDGAGAVEGEHIRTPVTAAPFEGYILLPGGINMKGSTVTSIRRWWLRDDAPGWDMAHENVAGFVTVQRYNEKGPVKRAG